MNELKAFYITDDNGIIKDLIIGTEESRQVAETILDYIEKSNDTWLKHRIIELSAEGIIHKGMNIVTTIKMNGNPIRCIINGFYSLIETIDKYMSIEDDYRKYSYVTKYIKFQTYDN